MALGCDYNSFLIISNWRYTNMLIWPRPLADNIEMSRLHWHGLRSAPFAAFKIVLMKPEILNQAVISQKDEFKQYKVPYKYKY